MDRQKNPFRSNERRERWNEAPVHRLDVLMFRGGGLEVAKREKLRS
jgi:hypothetical protein